MEEMVERGIALGLDEIAFTEHVDYGVKTDLNCSYPAYLAKLARMQERYGEQITLRKGIEFGVQLHTIDRFQRDFEQYDFDFVILSNHQINDQEFWRNEFQPGKTQEEIHTAYYQAIYDVMCHYQGYSVLGHLDMIKRYDPYTDKEHPYPDAAVMPLIDAILQKAIADGKGIELNTSCFRYQLPDWTPSRTILERYHELGGQILTIGSDAHQPKYLGAAVQEAQKLLREIGFTALCTFDHGQPHFHPL